MKKNSRNSFLTISIGMVYLWFGILKFFPNLSPAEGLAKSTVHALSFGLIPDNISIILLAIWETLVGMALIFNIWRKRAVILALVHMFFTFMPLLFFPEQVFSDGPFYLTLLGQYIVKNLVIISALPTLLEGTPKTAVNVNTQHKRLLKLQLIAKNFFKKMRHTLP